MMLTVTTCLVPFLLLVHFSGVTSIDLYGVRRESECKCEADEHENWTYCGEKGPDFWPSLFEQCGGMNQSPININTSEVVPDPNLKSLELKNYDVPVTKARIENNGHTIQVKPMDGVTRSINVDGEDYELDHFHAHWGKFGNKGSEHQIDGRAYDMEVHFVHLSKDQKIAVFGVLFRRSLRGNEELRNVTRDVYGVRYKHDSRDLRSNITLENLSPSNPVDIYRYNGSLTTPRCGEGVIWSVATSPEFVDRRVLRRLQRVHSVERGEDTEGCEIVNNYRPPQPLNGRKVYVSQRE